MSITTFILGESGTGKSTSMENLDPAKTFLLQIRPKPLPFRSPDWRPREKGDGDKMVGNVAVSDNAEQICKLLEKIAKSNEFDVVVIDDFQYLMSNEFMRGVTDEARGNAQFMKFNQIAKIGYDVLDAATKLPNHKRVYILAHTQTDDYGKTKIKTLGKLLDEKIVLEGMVTIVLRTQVMNGNYLFQTHNSGNDTVKSPKGMFEEDFIPNDLQAVDNVICDYYGINPQNNTGA